MQKYTFGLASILVAAVLDTGLMPAIADMTKIGEVLEGTANIAQEEGTRNEFKEEGVSAAKVIIKKNGAFSWTFNIMNADPEMFSEYIGGSYNATTKEWEYKGENTTIYKSIFIKPKEGLYWKVPKAEISAVVAGELSEEGLVTLNFTVTAVSPGDDLVMLMAGLVSNLPPEG
ncbi:hypothetical protein [Chishuiella sp.]|uniref:hypothetical protein n=1 Tax=Chishuiella sp. TaxID=1969467 RepID=UPI0028A74211|nr:hypothetical protein [Chishuiella sp.]